MTWDFGVFSLHVVQFFKIIKSSSHKNFLCFVIVHKKKTLFLYYFFIPIVKNPEYFGCIFLSIFNYIHQSPPFWWVVLHRMQGMLLTNWNCTIRYDHPICKKVMFLWKQDRWYHSIIYSLINRIWVYPKNAILIFQTMILLVKQVLVHVYGVHVIKCKVFYIYYWCIMKRFAMQMLFEINHSHVLFLILQMLCKSFMALEMQLYTGI